MAMSEPAGSPSVSATGPAPTAEIAERLRQLWEQGERPDVDAFLAGTGPLSAAELATVLRIDQRGRWRAGAGVPAEAYLQRYGVLQADLEAGFDLVYNEYLLRAQSGDQPNLQEYLQRFPQYADVLPTQLALDRALALDADCGPDGTLLAPTATPENETPARAAGGRAWPAIPGYEVIGELGRGAMGLVYQAWQVGLNRLVALKMIRDDDLASPEARARFRVEAEAIGRLQHPHLVQIYEVGEHDGRPFFAMEFVDGGSLAQRLDGTPWPPRRAAELVERLSRTIHYAHSRGIIHRDLKPGNILLQEQEGGRTKEELEANTGPHSTFILRPSSFVPKITDFGLAKLLVGGGAAKTQSGAILGTPSYMAPEQAGGTATAIGPAADVYALGAILYELLTGRPPFQAATLLETLEQVRTQEAVPLRRLQHRLPRDLETVCLKCLQKEPSKRYAGAAALADDLRLFLESVPIRARPVTPAERWWRWCRRNPALAALATSVAALLLLLALGASVAALWFGRERNRALDNLRRAEAAERDKTEKLWQSYLDRARAGRFSRQIGQRFDSLDALKEAAQIRPDDRLRDEAIACLALPDLRLGKSWEAQPPGTTALAFDAAYKRYARAEDQGAISIRRVADDQEMTRWSSPGLAASSLIFSPDGHYLAGISNARWARLWEVEHRRPVIEDIQNVHSLDFSADSRWLALGEPGGVIRLLELPAGTERQRLHTGLTSPGLTFRPDGQQLAVWPDPLSGNGAAVAIYDVGSGARITELSLGARRLASPVAWHPDGKRLAFGCTDSRACVMDVAARRVVLVVEGHVQHVWEVAFDASGDLLFTNSWDGTTRVWHTGTGSQLLVRPVSFGLKPLSRSGGRMGHLLHGNQVQLLEIAPGREYRTLVSSLGPGQGSYGEAAISTDGRILAAAMEDGVRLWELTSGRELAWLPLGLTISVSFHPHHPELLTSGVTGLLRWPIHRAARPGVNLHLGPPRPVPLSAVPYRARLSGDGRTVALACEGVASGLVLDLDKEAVQGVPVRHPGISYIALSPDGQWAASGGWHSPLVKVWNAGTGQVVKELSLGQSASVFFTPDSKALITSCGDEYCFWQVGSWQPGRRLRWELGNYPGFVAFSRDGALMALELYPGVIHLREAVTGRTLARLEDPNRDRATWLGFTPDGTRLVTVATYAKTLHVWDLRTLRRELAEIGLDWDQPAYAAEVPEPAGSPLRLTVEFGSFETPQKAVVKYSLALALQPLNPEAYFRRGRAHASHGQLSQALSDCNLATALQPGHAAAHFLCGQIYRVQQQPRLALAAFSRAIEHQRPGRAAYYDARAQLQWTLEEHVQALADWRDALALEPGSASRYNNLAWYYVTGPAAIRAPATALPLAEKALELEPGNLNARNTLGVAYFRLGRYQEARACFERNLEQGQELAAFDLFFLAMCFQQLGDPAKAKDCYQRAREWVQQRKDMLPQHAAELRAFQAEAEAMLQ
jgi:serine/threonine protein kinase/WD40 repeat protein/Tfp pilus assembly protein PilF